LAVKKIFIKTQIALDRINESDLTYPSTDHFCSLYWSKSFKTVYINKCIVQTKHGDAYF